ncbi:MAG: diphosphate--fructose-6-phosphate 1-phosphotransferase [Chlamydiae bacterium]|nr:diphosphate--fructose-6-phosphate 1-phosphotransferase [Chlamydiota bacterium]
MINHESLLQKLRRKYPPTLPKILQHFHQVRLKKLGPTTSIKDQDRLKQLFPKTYGRPLFEGIEGDARKGRPLKVGVVLSGGQAAGGHNVIAGLFDALHSLDPKSSIFGFLGGPSGIIEGKYKELTEEILHPYRNQGGFDLIGSGRTKIETPDQLAAALKVAQNLKLDGLVIIGGDDSNTNAAVLAEYFLSQNCNTTVVGVPKTIDGDLKSEYIETSFGFDTACKTYSEMIGNIARDAMSAKKYFHFIKLMGRSASHIALECALQTHPTFTLIGEEVAASKKTLSQIVKEISDLITLRSEKGMNYGVILVPEGLIEFIPEIKTLISELNTFATEGEETILKKLSANAKKTFNSLPPEIRRQLSLERDPHGNIQVSLIETEKLLLELVTKEIGGKKGNKFSGLTHFFGYEGRAGFPSNFDANYCYSLGFTAALLVDEKLTGYMSCVKDLHRPVSEWKIMGLPLTMLMNIEVRKGKEKPVIQKALVDLKGKAFSYFDKNRKSWAERDSFCFPGPIQFFGESELVDSIPLTLRIESI